MKKLFSFLQASESSKYPIKYGLPSDHYFEIAHNKVKKHHCNRKNDFIYICTTDRPTVAAQRPGYFKTCFFRGAASKARGTSEKTQYLSTPQGRLTCAPQRSGIDLRKTTAWANRGGFAAIVPAWRSLKSWSRSSPSADARCSIHISCWQE